MRRRFSSFVGLLACVLTAACGAGAGEQLQLASLDGLHDLLLQRFRAQQFSGAVLVTEGDSVLFQREYGMAEQRGTRPILRDTRFDIGSVVKLLTSVAVLRLAQDGVLELDATLSHYLPDVAAAVRGSGSATVRQLLQHRAGFGDYLGHPAFRSDPGRFRTVEDYLSLVRAEPLTFAPGTGLSYSNSGFVMLGAVVEAVTGREWHAVVGELVLAPAGMSATSAFPSPASATGYTRENGRLADTSGRWPPAASPAGGMHATAGDLQRLVAALMSDRLLEPRWTDVLLRNFEGPDGEPVERAGPWDIAWEGGAPGLNAHVGYDAPSQRIVIVLANMDPPAASAVGRAILREGRTVR
jgi:CubicO group peptidase (beta-lactamase class C family)